MRIFASETHRVVIVAESAADRADITELTRGWSGRTVTFADGLFDEITDLKTRSGILATIDIPAEGKDTADGLWLLLEDIQDPGTLAPSCVPLEQLA